jgi:transposase InsO family protein
LQAQVSQLQKENEKLKKQLQAADDMMGAAGEIIRSLRGLPPSRSSSARAKRAPKPTSTTDEDPEPEPAQAILRRALTQLKTKTRLGSQTARMLGIDTKTLRRWIERLEAGEPLRQRRGGVMRAGPPASEERVRELVQDLHGLSGAQSLARSVTGVSRRRAAAIKHEVMTAIERTRQADCTSVEVNVPGIVRGFDAMHLADGFALIAADSSVPFRTSIQHACSYDAQSVAEVLDKDFRTHGAPLVLREDRAKCHTAEPVASVLREHGVLVLHGPPRYPQYYGQLERQNAEHRAWWHRRLPTSGSPQPQLDEMKSALNERWLRPTLGWRNAAQCWNERPFVDEDRDEFRDDVQRRAARLRASNISEDLAMRLAIEQALTKRGLLKVTPGRLLLCD